MKKYALMGAVLCLLGWHTATMHARGIFLTLTQVEQYAESLPEFIETETDWLNPDFSSFHKEHRPGRIRRFLSWFGLGKNGWNPREFTTLLRSLIKKRELDGLMGDFIQKYQATMGDHLFIWTDLFGAFHSLVRDLVELRSKGIIADDFKILKQEYLLVFNGNVIDHSPYVLETLTLVMRLLEANPQQVVYIRGYHEDKQEWQSYGLAQELKIRAAGLSRELIPLNKSVTQFFNTLPLGLFLPTITETAINALLIANNENSKSGFDANKFAGFLEEEGKSKLSEFKLSNALAAKKKVHIKVLISGENRSITYHQTVGLTMLGMQREALRWLSFSSPTGRNRRLYEFFYDAFIEITVGNKLDDWTIALYNQDVRKLFGFKKIATYYLLTGQRLQEGAQKVKQKLPKPEEMSIKKESVQKNDQSKEPKKKEENKQEEQLPGEGKKEGDVATVTAKQDVAVGSTMDLSKSASMIGKAVKEGLDIAFKQIVQSGVGSFMPRIIINDDAYTPTKTRQLVQDFLDKSHIDIFLNPVGSATTESYLDWIKEGKVLVLFPFTGAPVFRKPDLKSIAHMRVGYVDEGRALAEYALDELQAQKIVIFYQNDAFGRGALQGSMEIFKKRGKEVIQVPYDRNDVQLDHQAKIIEQADPDTIFFFAVTPSAQSLIRELGVSFLRGRNLIGMSVYDESFARFLESKGLTFVMVRVVPNPETSQLDIVKEYRDAAKKNKQALSFNALEAFINANVFFDILKRIKPPLTKEKIIKEIEGIKNYNFKGIELDFDPNTRELVNTLWIDDGKGPWIKKEVRSLSDKKPAQEEKRVEGSPEQKKEEVKEPEIKKVVPETKKEAEKLPQKKTELKKESNKKEAEPSPHERKELVVGATIDLSKGGSAIGKSIKEGLDLAFAQASKENGVGSYLPRITIYDDEYAPSKTRSLVSNFIDANIDIFVNPVGSATTEAYLNFVKAGKALVLFPFTGAPIFRKPELKSIAHMRVGYVDEGRVLAQYALDTIETKKAAIFYQNDTAGQGVLQGVMEEFDKRGFKNVVKIPYERNDTSFEPQVNELKKANPDTIFFFAVAPAVKSLIRQLGAPFFKEKHLIGMSVYNELFEEFLAGKGLKFVMVRVVPDPKSSELEIVQDYRAAAQKSNHALNFTSLESFINANVFFDIIKRIKPPLTKEKIIKEIEGIKNYNFKGIELDFDPNSRELVRTLWIDDGKGPWIKKDVRPSSSEKPEQKEERVEASPEPKKELEPQKEFDKKEAEPSPHEKRELILGATIDLSKGASAIGKLLKEGLDLAFDKVAQGGGVGSYFPRITIYDDEYTPKKTRPLVSKFLESNIDIFLDPVGSAATNSYIDLIKQGKVLVLFPYTGSSLFRKPELKSIAHMRVGYEDEGHVLADYALDTLKTKKSAIFYQNDAFGVGALRGVMDEFEKRGFKNIVKVPYERNDTSFEPQVELLKKADPDTIFFFAVVPAVKSLIRQLGVPFFKAKHLIGMSVYNELFEKFLAGKGLKFVMIRVVPDPKSSELEIVRDYRAAAQKSNHALNVTSLEAFINANVFFDILKRIKPPLTKEKIIKEIEGIKNYNFKGIELDFDPNSRELVRTLWIDDGKGLWIKKEVRPSSSEKLEQKEERVEESPEQKKEEVKEPEIKKVVLGTKQETAVLPQQEEGSAITKKSGGKEDEKKLLVIGSTQDLSRSVKFQSKSVKTGIEMRLKEEQDAGKQFMQVVIVDDEYTPRKTVKEVKKFLDQGIDILLNPLGSPTLAAYLDLVREGKVLVLFPMTGAPLFRQKDLKYMAHIRPSYKTEGKILTEYALDTLHAKKGVMFYQDDVFGQGLLAGAQEILKKRGIADWLAVPYQRNDVNFEKQVATINKYDPGVILFFSVTIAARGLLRQLGIQEVSAKHLLGSSEFGEIEFRKFMKQKGLKMFYLNAVPNPIVSNIEIVQQYREAAKQAGIPLDVFSLESYMATDFLINILKQIKGVPTKEKIINAIENIKDYDYKGLKFNFDLETRTLSSSLWMATADPDWKRIDLKQKKEEVKEPEIKKVVPETKQETAALPQQEEEKKKEPTVDIGEKKPIAMGSMQDLSKGGKQQGNAVRAGIELRLQEGKSTGENLISHVEFVDDEYTPRKTLQEVKDFLKRGIDIFLSPLGSPTLAVYLDMIKEGKVLVLFPNTGAPLFRKKDLKYIAHIRPSYKEEGRLLTAYALDTLKAQKGVMFYQDDAFGQGLLEGAQEELKKKGVSDWLAVPYIRNDVTFTKQISTIKNYDPDVILFFSTTTAAIGLVREMGIQEISAKPMLANSDFGEEKFLKFISEKGLKLIYINVVPNPQLSDLAIVQQFRDAAVKYEVKVDPFSLESYIATDFLLSILKKIPGAVTKEKLIDAIEQIKDYDYKGLKFNFDPENRTLSSTFWLYTGSPNWKQIELK